MVEEYTVEECVVDVDEDGDEDFVELVNIYTCDRAPESVRIFSRSFSWIERGAYSGYEEQESEE